MSGEALGLTYHHKSEKQMRGYIVQMDDETVLNVVASDFHEVIDAVAGHPGCEISKIARICKSNKVHIVAYPKDVTPVMFYGQSKTENRRAEVGETERENP